MPIWPFGSRQPRTQDAAFADLAQMFLFSVDGAEDSVRVFALGILGRPTARA